MSEETTLATILRITEEERTRQEDAVVKESPLTIIFNGQELVTMLCSPSRQKYLALGFLESEGLIHSKEDIKQVLFNQKRGTVRVETNQPSPIDGDLLFKRHITSGCGKGTTFYSVADAINQTRVDSKATLEPSRVYSLMKEFQHRSEVFKDTGGVHSAALSDGESILIFSEDIGRHNAIDKIFGECLWEGKSAEDCIILTSGRVSSEILFKIVKRGIPIIVSKSAATDVAIRTAEDLGITLVGFVRGRRMNVYSNDWRISG